MAYSVLSQRFSVSQNAPFVRLFLIRVHPRSSAANFPSRFPPVTTGLNFIFPTTSTTYCQKSDFTVRPHFKLALKRSFHA